MTVYFQGTEIQDFLQLRHVQAFSHDTTSAYRNTSNTRCCIRGDYDSTTDVNITDRIDTTLFSATECWTHFVLALGGGLSGGWGGANSRPCVMWRGTGGVNFLAIRKVASTGQVALLKWNGSSWDVLDTSPGAIGTTPGNVSNPLKTAIDIQIRLGNPGTFRLYSDGVPVLVGDNYDLSGVDEITQLLLGKWYYSGANSQTGYSEVIVSSWNTIGSKLVSRIPSSNGTHVDMEGTYTDVNEITPASTYITSEEVDERESYVFTSFPDLGEDERIESVKLTANGLRDIEGPQSMNLFVRVDGTDYDGDDQALNVAPDDYFQSWEVSPVTSDYWTPTELNASEFGIRSRE